MVAADGAGVEAHETGDDASRVRALVDHVACGNEMVLCGVEVDLFEERLEGGVHAVDVADNDETPLVLKSRDELVSQAGHEPEVVHVGPTESAIGHGPIGVGDLDVMSRPRRQKRQTKRRRQRLVVVLGFADKGHVVESRDAQEGAGDEEEGGGDDEDPPAMLWLRHGGRVAGVFWEGGGRELVPVPVAFFLFLVWLSTSVVLELFFGSFLLGDGEERDIFFTGGLKP